MIPCPRGSPTRMKHPVLPCLDGEPAAHAVFLGWRDGWMRRSRLWIVRFTALLEFVSTQQTAFLERHRSPAEPQMEWTASTGDCEKNNTFNSAFWRCRGCECTSHLECPSMPAAVATSSPETWDASCEPPAALPQTWVRDRDLLTQSLPYELLLDVHCSKTC